MHRHDEKVGESKYTGGITMQPNKQQGYVGRRSTFIAIMMLVPAIMATGGAGSPGTELINATQEHACLAQVPGPHCGERLWVSRFDGLAFQDSDGTLCLCAAPYRATSMGTSDVAGVTVVTGHYTVTSSFGFGGATFLVPQNYWITLGYSSEDGSVLWIKRIAAGDDDPFRGRPRDMAMSSDGMTAVVAGDGLLNNLRHFVTIAYDVQTGQEMWRVIQPDSPTSNSNRVAIDPTGETVFVTGDRWGSHDHADRYPTDILTVAYDMEDGTERWQADHGGSGSNESVADIRVAPDGSTVYVTGSTAGGGVSGDITTVAYDAASGAEIWNTRYDGPSSGFDEASSIDVNQDGSALIVAGLSYAPDGWGPDLAVLAYDPTDGTMLWETRHRETALSSNVPAEVQISPNGDTIAVTGYTTSVFSGTSDFLTILLDAQNGALEWSATYEGPGDGHDRPVGIDFTPNGTRLFVGGASVGHGSDMDYTLVAYDVATGEQIWLDRYHNPVQQDVDEPSVDVLTALSVDGDSERVMVTGNSPGLLTGSWNMVTIAYMVDS